MLDNLYRAITTINNSQSYVDLTYESPRLLQMNYSITNAAFLFPWLAMMYLAWVYYHRRQMSRLVPKIKEDSQDTSRKAYRELILFFIAFSLIKLVVGFTVDQPWDYFKDAYDIPARSIEGFLLIEFANLGVMATILIVIVTSIEIHDWRRNKQRM